ncbi:MAG: ABC transporter ATP-binding protein [Desulfatibacillaceae bacterium]
MDGGKPLIRVRDLEARYGDTTVLKDVTLDVGRGEVLTIVGGSGCGKSTLMKHMIGLYRPHAGTVEVDGRDVSRLDENEYKDLVRTFGILYQGGALLGSMTVGQNILLPIREYTDLDRESADSLVRIKLGMVHLSGYADHLPSELSGGMQKRAALARAMALNPKILFFDEPSAGLDPITAADLDNLILRLNRIFKTTMVVVTHELRSIMAISDRCVVLDKERRGVAAVGDPRELAKKSGDSLVRRFFNPERTQGETGGDAPAGERTSGGE